MDDSVNPGESDDEDILDEHIKSFIEDNKQAIYDMKLEIDCVEQVLKSYYEFKDFDEQYLKFCQNF